MTSADKCFKQFGPRSGQTFCPNLILVKMFVTLKVMKKLIYLTLSSADNPFKQFGSKLMYFNNALNFFMTLSYADNHFKQFGPRSGSTFCPDLIGVQTVRHFRGYD